MALKTKLRLAFSDEMVQAIFRGEKVETRRLPAVQWDRLEVGHVLLLAETTVCKSTDAQENFAWYKNNPAPVLLNGSPVKWRWPTNPTLIAKYMPNNFARLELVVVRKSKERLLDITEPAALREGFRPSKTWSAKAAFLAYWDHLHDERHTTNPIVYAIRFEPRLIGSWKTLADANKAVVS